MGPDEQNRESRSEPDNGSDDRHLTIAMMFVGVAMMFVGFLDVFLSISGGFELAGASFGPRRHGAGNRHRPGIGDLSFW